MQPDFNPDVNPFESIMGGGGAPTPGGQGGAQGGMPPALMAALQGQGGMPGGAPEQGGPSGGMPGMPGALPPMPEIQESSTMPGSNPGGSKHLISALQSLQKFITESADQQEIQAARILTGILGKLIDRDQENQAKKEQGQEGQGGMPMPGMGGGMPPMPGGPSGAPQMPPMPGM